MIIVHATIFFVSNQTQKKTNNIHFPFLIYSKASNCCTVIKFVIWLLQADLVNAVCKRYGEASATCTELNQTTDAEFALR